MGALTADFFELYFEKYSVRPSWSGKEAAMLKRVIAWAKDNFGEDAQQKIRLSLGCFLSSGGYEERERHPFALFAKNPVKWVPPTPTKQDHIVDNPATNPLPVQANSTMSDDDLRASILKRPRETVAGMICWADSSATLSRSHPSFQSDLYARTGRLVRELLGEEYLKGLIAEIRANHKRSV